MFTHWILIFCFSWICGRKWLVSRGSFLLAHLRETPAQCRCHHMYGFPIYNWLQTLDWLKYRFLYWSICRINRCYLDLDLLLLALGGGDGVYECDLCLGDLEYDLDRDLDLDLEWDADLDLDLDFDRDLDLDLPLLSSLSNSRSCSLIFFALCFALKNSYRPSFSHPSLKI